METIITAATILAMYLNAGTAAQGDYCYNADMANGRLTTLYVYDKSGETLSPKLQHRYTYDEHERLDCKEVMRWNGASRQWEPAYRLDLSYQDGGYTVERRCWDGRLQVWQEADAQAVYRQEAGCLLSVNYLRRTPGTAQLVLADSMFIVNPKDGLLLAATPLPAVTDAHPQAEWKAAH